MAQDKKFKPNSISVSYYGEIITHPGLRIGANYNLRQWEKVKTSRKGVIKTKHKVIEITPSVGFYYHRRYQTGIFILPEIEYFRIKQNGKFFSIGLGLGYMRTFIPNTYEVLSNGEVNKINAGHDYFIRNYYVIFGKDLSVKKGIPLQYFIKPQLMTASPNFPKKVAYFILEIGIKYKLKN